MSATVRFTGMRIEGPFFTLRINADMLNKCYVDGAASQQRARIKHWFSAEEADGSEAFSLRAGYAGTSPWFTIAQAPETDIAELLFTVQRIRKVFEPQVLGKLGLTQLLYELTNHGRSFTVIVELNTLTQDGRTRLNIRQANRNLATYGTVQSEHCQKLMETKLCDSTIFLSHGRGFAVQLNKNATDIMGAIAQLVALHPVL